MESSEHYANDSTATPPPPPPPAAVSTTAAAASTTKTPPPQKATMETRVNIADAIISSSITYREAAAKYHYKVGTMRNWVACRRHGELTYVDEEAKKDFYKIVQERQRENRYLPVSEACSILTELARDTAGRHNGRANIRTVSEKFLRDTCKEIGIGVGKK